MQQYKQTKSYSQAISQLANNLASKGQFQYLTKALLQLPEADEQLQKPKSTSLKQQRQVQQVKEQQAIPEKQPQLSNNIKQRTVSHNQPLQTRVKTSKQQYKEQGKPQEDRSATPIQIWKSQRQILSEPPLIEQKRNYTEQSSQKSRTNQKQSVSSQKKHMKSSQSQYINLELTQRSKKQKSSLLKGKVDSLLYSDVTLLYSNDTGFGNSNKNKNQEEVASVKKLEEQSDINTRMQRAQSRECQRIRTQSQRASQAQKAKDQSQKEAKEQGSIFKTQINEYKSKISKIRQLKENKKRKLEIQLHRINQQLEDLAKKQHQHSASKLSKPSNFESRVKISDNSEAKVKAVKLVRNLYNQKKNREDLHLGQLHAIDKNINNYMEELMKERYKNEQRIKQRKKLQIIDRMKQQEMRKIEQQKQKEKNVQFVQQLRGSNSRNQVEAQRKVTQSVNPPATQSVKSKQRHPTKKSQSVQEITPELSRKKAFLKKIRNINFKKEKVDQYEQLLH